MGIRATAKQKEHIRSCLNMARKLRLGLMFDHMNAKNRRRHMFICLKMACGSTNDVNRATRKIHWSRAQGSHNFWR
jgi:hypothetical protein